MPNNELREGDLRMLHGFDAATRDRKTIIFRIIRLTRRATTVCSIDNDQCDSLPRRYVENATRLPCPAPRLISP